MYFLSKTASMRMKEYLNQRKETAVKKLIEATDMGDVRKQQGAIWEINRMLLEIDKPPVGN